VLISKRAKFFSFEPTGRDDVSASQVCNQKYENQAVFSLHSYLYERQGSMAEGLLTLSTLQWHHQIPLRKVRNFITL